MGAISGTHCQIGALIGAISPVMDLHGRQMHSEKSDQLILASGGSEHAWLFT